MGRPVLPAAASRVSLGFRRGRCPAVLPRLARYREDTRDLPRPSGCTLSGGRRGDVGGGRGSLRDAGRYTFRWGRLLRMVLPRPLFQNFMPVLTCWLDSINCVLALPIIASSRQYIILSQSIPVLSGPNSLALAMAMLQTLVFISATDQTSLMITSESRMAGELMRVSKGLRFPLFADLNAAG